MTIYVTCIKCKNNVAIEDEQRGQIVACQHCGVKLQAPPPRRPDPNLDARMSFPADSEPGVSLAQSGPVLGSSQRRGWWKRRDIRPFRNIVIVAVSLAALVVVAVVLVQVGSSWSQGRNWKSEINEEFSKAKTEAEHGLHIAAIARLSDTEALIEKAIDEPDRQALLDRVVELRMDFNRRRNELVQEKTTRENESAAEEFAAKHLPVLAEAQAARADYQFLRAQSILINMQNELRQLRGSVRFIEPVKSLADGIEAELSRDALVMGRKGRVVVGGKFAAPSVHYREILDQAISHGQSKRLMDAATASNNVAGVVEIARRMDNLEATDPEMAKNLERLHALESEADAISNLIADMRYADALARADQLIDAGDDQGEGVFWRTRTVLESRLTFPLPVEDSQLAGGLRKSLDQWPINWWNRFLLALLEIGAGGSHAESAKADLRELYHLNMVDPGAIQLLLAEQLAEKLPLGDLRGRLFGVHSCFDAGGRQCWLLPNGLLVTKSARSDDEIRIIVPHSGGRFESWRIAWLTIKPDEPSTKLEINTDRASAMSVEQLAEKVQRNYVWLKDTNGVVLARASQCTVPSNVLIDSGLKLSRAKAGPAASGAGRITFELPKNEDEIRGCWVIHGRASSEVTFLQDPPNPPHLLTQEGARLSLVAGRDAFEIVEPNGVNFRYPLLGGYHIPPEPLALASLSAKAELESPFAMLRDRSATDRRRIASGAPGAPGGKGAAAALGAIARLTRYAIVKNGWYVAPGFVLGKEGDDARALWSVDATGAAVKDARASLGDEAQLAEISEHIIRGYYFRPGVGAHLMAALQPKLAYRVAVGDLLIPPLDELRLYASREYEALVELARRGGPVLDRDLKESLLILEEIRSPALQTPIENAVGSSIGYPQAGTYTAVQADQSAAFFNLDIQRRLDRHNRIVDRLLLYDGDVDPSTQQQMLLQDTLKDIAREAARALADNKLHQAMVLSADASDMMALSARMIAADASGRLSQTGESAFISMMGQALTDKHLGFLFQRIDPLLSAESSGAYTPPALRLLLSYRNAFISLPLLKDIMVYKDFYVTRTEVRPELWDLQSDYIEASRTLEPVVALDRIAELIQGGGRDALLEAQWRRVLPQGGLQGRLGMAGIENVLEQTKNILVGRPSIEMFVKIKRIFDRAGRTIPAVGVDSAVSSAFPLILDGLPDRRDALSFDRKVQNDLAANQLTDPDIDETDLAVSLMNAGVYFFHLGLRDEAESCWLHAAQIFSRLSSVARDSLIGAEEIAEFAPLRCGLASAALGLTLLHSSNGPASSLVRANCESIIWQAHELKRIWAEQKVSDWREDARLPAGAVIGAANRIIREQRSHAPAKASRRLWWWHYGL
jgi:DNA-directed RNA polymerase subunit RPC12/RpoP